MATNKINNNTTIRNKIKYIDSLINILNQAWNTRGSSKFGQIDLCKLAEVLDIIPFQELIGFTCDFLEQRKSELKSLYFGAVYNEDWFKNFRPFQRVLINRCGYWEPAFFYGYGYDETFGNEANNVALCIGIDNIVFPKELIRPFYSFKDMYLKEDEETCKLVRNKYPNYE